jgi:hypothetical protein
MPFFFVDAIYYNCKIPNYLRKHIFSSIIFVGIICIRMWRFGILPFKKSSATQASLLTNLSPWLGIISYVFLKIKPATNFDWNDSGIIWNGYVGRF